MSIFRQLSQHSRYAALFLLLLTVAWQAGCAVRTSRDTIPGVPGQAVTSDFVDLRAGNRVVVVIPVLRSGGYILPSLRTGAIAGRGEIEAGPDFLGYEQDFYTVKRGGNGVRVHFSHGVVWRNGKGQRVHAPRVAMFEHTDNTHVRLVFLQRVSEADHDMAIVSAGDLPSLDGITRQVTGRAECRSSRVGNCTWVPNGIAVRPE